MATYTITYSNKAKGFPSFYTYSPESIAGMNNRLYTFNGGNVYMHNSNNVDRNTFYGVRNDSTMTTVFNQAVLDNKIFKTINIEGTDAWEVELTSDLQNTGTIEYDWFNKEENSYRAFVRNTGGDPIGDEDIPLRSMNGIGKTNDYSVFFSTTYKIDYPMDVNLNNVSVGDVLYYAAAPSYDDLVKVGDVLGIAHDATATPQENYIIVDTSTGTPPTGTSPYFMAAKNSIAESHGVLGHYGEITMTNDSATPIQLFAVESEVMESKV